MATFLNHKACPNCGSRDNRGVWDDGSEWCFGCHDYTPPQGEKKIENWLDKQKSSVFTTIVKLPEDAQAYFPPEVKAWLNKYNLTNEELAKLQPLYSMERESLIFPVYAQGELVMYQERMFGADAKRKYLTTGAKDVLHILHVGKSPTNEIVVVEDAVSACRVSTVMDALPVWGSYLNVRMANYLATRYARLRIWLDYNKRIEAIKQARMFRPLFEQVSTTVTPLDPKEYSHEFIRSMVNEH